MINSPSPRRCFRPQRAGPPGRRGPAQPAARTRVDRRGDSPHAGGAAAGLGPTDADRSSRRRDVALLELRAEQLRESDGESGAASASAFARSCATADQARA